MCRGSCPRLDRWLLRAPQGPLKVNRERGVCRQAGGRPAAALTRLTLAAAAAAAGGRENAACRTEPASRTEPAKPLGLAMDSDSQDMFAVSGCCQACAVGAGVTTGVTFRRR